MRLTLLTTLFALTLPASACAFSEKNDPARLFSGDAIQRAAATIETDREQYGPELRIQTYRAIPWNKKLWSPVSKMDEAARERFFTRWAEDSARAGSLNGVFILICQEPLAVRVVVQIRGPSPPITQQDGDVLQAQLLERLKEKKNDEALAHAVEEFHQHLYAVYGDKFVNVRFDWWPLTAVFLGVIGTWLALYFLHGFSEGAFHAGSAGVNPLALGVGGNLFAGLRAVRAGLAGMRASVADIVLSHTTTLTEIAPPVPDPPAPPGDRP
jgi:hypothetical protein